MSPLGLQNYQAFKLGGFKFQVQRVNNGAVRHRLPGAWQSADIFVDACSGRGRWRSTRAACTPTSRCPWAGTGAAAHWCFRWCHFATGCTDRQRTPGSRTARQALKLGHLFPPIVGQGFAQRSRHMPELLREALSGTPRIRPVHPGQDDQACRSLHQGADGRAIPCPLDQVAFPLAGHGAGGHLGRTFGHRRHVGDLAASIRPARPRLARLAHLTQRGQQCAPQDAAGQHIQAHIDGLGRELFPHVIRIRASEASGNLFGRAALSQMGPDILPEPEDHEFARPPRLMRPSRRQGVRRAGTIRSPHRVAGVLAAHGAGGAAPTPTPSSAGNGRGPGPGSRSHVLRHSCVCRISLAWQHLSRSGPQCCTWS